MKILLISSIYPTAQHPDYGTFVRNIGQLYQAAGHTVDVVNYRREGTKATKLANWWRFLNDIKRALARAEDYDLINLHYPFLAAFTVRKQMDRLRVPLVVSLHGSDIFPDSRLKRFSLKATLDVLRRCQRIIVPSAFFLERVAQAYGLPADKFRAVAPGGFDGRLFYPARADARPAPKRYRIGFASRLVAGKGWTTLLNAMSQLDAASPGQYQLLLAGSGPDEGAIRQALADAGLTQQVELVGALPMEQLADFYRSLDVFVFPSQLEESLGMVGIEALACGIPVAASDIGGITEYIIDGYNGVLVEPGRAEQLARAISRLAQAGRDENMAPEQLAESVSRYESHQVARQLDDVLREVV